MQNSCAGEPASGLVTYPVVELFAIQGDVFNKAA
jgi:hypothetical protein